MSYDLHHAECLAFMAELPAASFDLILADPPYMTTNLHFDKAPALDWQAWWAQAWRVLKPNGVVVLFAADLFTVDLILSQRAQYRYRLVWCKTMGTGFLRANKQQLKAHEDVLIFGKLGDQSTYNPQKAPGDAYTNKRKKAPQTKHYTNASSGGCTDNHSGDRHPLSWIFCNSVATVGRLHPTQKPIPLLTYLIRTYSNPGDTVLDCFAGSGSTIEACLLEGRHGTGCELDADYYAKAQARLQAVLAKPQLDFAQTG